MTVTTETYAMVRGSAIRVTALDHCGGLQQSPIRYAVSTCVARVGIGEVIEAGSNELLRDSEDDPTLHFVREPEIMGYVADIDFLRVDPGVLNLVAGMDPLYDWDSTDHVIGFDANMRVRAGAFALEVWSKLDRVACAGLSGEFGVGAFGEEPFGGALNTRLHGYTLFPFLKGGYITAFEFTRGVVSFKVVGAQTRINPKWGGGPYILLDETDRRLPTPVSRNTAWRNLIYPGNPPATTQGIAEFLDVIDNGDASNPHPLATGTVEGGSASITSSDQVEGGNAA